MPLFDTHAHLDQEEFDADREDVVLAARAAGLCGVLAVGVTADSSEKVIELAQREDIVHAAVGIHPNHAALALPGDWDRVVALARQPQVVALGETGLDRYWDYTPFELQQDYFARHLALMQSTGLPVVIHSRDCDADLLPMLREARSRGPLHGIMHSFASTLETAEEALDLGLYVSFSGMLTYKKNDALRQVAAAIPADRLLVETDSPYLSPEPRRGKRNEPANVQYTAARLAEVRGLTPDELGELTSQNARRLFRLASPA